MGRRRSPAERGRGLKLPEDCGTARTFVARRARESTAVPSSALAFRHRNRRGSFFISGDETVVLDPSAAAVATQRLQFISQRDREFSNSAPDFFGVYGGEP